MAGGDKRDYRSLGEILRDAREEEELSLGELSQRTKISITMIEALEADDLDRLVSPVYARSFLRSLAEALGLEPGWLVTKYDNATASSGPSSPLPPSGQPTPENPIAPPGAVPAPADRAPAVAVDDGTTVKVEGTRVHRVKARRRSPAVPWTAIGLGAGAIAVLVALALLLPGALRGCAGDGAGDDGVQLEDPRATSTPSLLLADEEVAVDPGGDPPVEIASELAAPGAPVAAPATPDDGSGGAVEEADLPATTPAAPPQEVEGAGEEVVQPPEDEAGMGSILRRPEGSAPLQLELKAVRRTDVWVGADGAERRRRTLGPGQVWQLSARDHFELLLPEPDAVEIRLDGVRREAPGRDRVFLLYPDPGP